MAYDQAAADWQARAERAEADLARARAELRTLWSITRAAGVPTTPGHERQHQEMDRRFAESAPDPCADVPDAPEPGRRTPEPGERWRTGTSEGTDELTLYRHVDGGPGRGRLVGMMREPADAALVVEAVNAFLENMEEDGRG
jgi:hypothetical protein